MSGTQLPVKIVQLDNPNYIKTLAVVNMGQANIVDVLPTASTDLTGFIFYLTTDGKYYTTDGTTWQAGGGGGVSRAEWDQNGFVNHTDSTMSFTDGSLTFSIQPTATSFD